MADSYDQESLMKIMVAFDGTNVSNEALKIAGEYATALNARVYLVMSMVGGPEVPREEFVKHEHILEFAQAQFTEAKIPCEAHLSVRGLEAGEDLVQFARENQIDLIIIGIRRRSKVGKLVFGSTAQYVVLKAPCPVLSVK
jgi:nucleotide-binding universal stress UspA family protein